MRTSFVLRTAAIGICSFTIPLFAIPTQDTVFTSVDPCVIFDTRPAQGGTGPLAAEEERAFDIVGTTADFPAQGGTAGGCGVPGFNGAAPVTRSVLINYVAIGAAGPGQLKVWAGNETEPAQGAVLNYQALTPPLNTANAVVTEVRQDVPGGDIRVKAKVSGVHVRGIILGYFTHEHITGIIASTGLTGSATEGTAILGVANQGVGTAQLDPAGSVSGDVLVSTGDGVEWQSPPIGPPGADGIVSIVSWAASAPTVSVSASFSFVASAPVTIADSPKKLTGSSVAILGTTGGSTNISTTLCYQSYPPGFPPGPVTTFGNYLSLSADTTRSSVPASASVTLPIGNYLVGQCVRTINQDLNNNDYVTGWIIVSN